MMQNTKQENAETGNPKEEAMENMPRAQKEENSSIVHCCIRGSFLNP